MNLNDSNVLCLIDETLAQIKAHPWLHRQFMWRTSLKGSDGNICGTAFCKAGWAIEMDPKSCWEEVPDGAWGAAYDGVDRDRARWFNPVVDGEYMSPAQAGAVLLLNGIDATDCECWQRGQEPFPELFLSEQKLEDIERIIKEMREFKYFTCTECGQAVSFDEFRKKGDPVEPMWPEGFRPY